MPRLFDPLQLRSLQLPNRIIIAPMCQYSATDGVASDWHLIHLGHLALAGAGLLILEATAVSPVGRISAADLGLYSDACETALARTLAAIRTYSDLPLAIQLAHAGRKASTRVPWEGGAQMGPGQAAGWQTVAPSALAHGAGEAAPRALGAADLRQVREEFTAAARRAVRLGFDGIELHAAHGYLLHQFLSPLSNQRRDDYGGSLENRMRLVLEVFEDIRAVVPAATPVWVRISATDWVEGGWDPEQSIALAGALQQRGCDAIHVSSGGISPRQAITPAPGYQVPLAAAIRAATGLCTIAVGLITGAAQADAVIQSGAADAVALARAMLYDPRWPWHAAAELGAQVRVPRQYSRAAPADHPGLFLHSAAAGR